MAFSPTEKGHYLIRIVRSGIGCLRIGEKLYLLCPGTAFIIRPGEVKEVIPLKETVRGFKEILEGKHDDIPESLFLFAGGIDEVVERFQKNA